MITKDLVEIVRYENRFKNDWDSFVDNAENGTFLFHRAFMEYHKDRFEDFSLMLFCKGSLKAILPANVLDKTIYSHQGLTFGGLLIAPHCTDETHAFFWQHIKDYLSGMGFTDLIIKEMPTPYQRQMWNDDLSLDRKLVQQTSNFQVNLNDFKISKSKLKHYHRAVKNNFLLVEDDAFEPFWEEILEPLLKEKYLTKPLHSLEEITSLKKKFHKNIIQCNLYYKDEIVAGITLFVHAGFIVKSQYGASSALGKKLRAMDFLFIELIHKFKKLNFAFFDMGTATDASFPEGINLGLMNQKKELGCRAYPQNIYQIRL